MIEVKVVNTMVFHERRIRDDSWPVKIYYLTDYTHERDNFRNNPESSGRKITRKMRTRRTKRARTRSRIRLRTKTRDTRTRIRRRRTRAKSKSKKNNSKNRRKRIDWVKFNVP